MGVLIGASPVWLRYVDSYCCISYCFVEWQKLLTYEARASLEYSDRRFGSDDFPSACVICSVQQELQCQACPFRTVVAHREHHIKNHWMNYNKLILKLWHFRRKLLSNLIFAKKNLSISIRLKEPSDKGLQQNMWPLAWPHGVLNNPCQTNLAPPYNNDTWGLFLMTIALMIRSMCHSDRCRK